MSNFNNIKESIELIANLISEQYNENIEIDQAKDIVELGRLFNDIIASRSETIDSFSELLEKKSAIYQAALYIWYSSLYITLSKEKSYFIITLLDILERVGNIEFSDNFEKAIDTMIAYQNGDTKEESLEPFIAYFSRLFLEVSNILYPEVNVEFKTTISAVSWENDLEEVLDILTEIPSNSIDIFWGDKFIFNDSDSSTYYLYKAVADGTYTAADTKVVSKLTSDPLNPQLGDIYFVDNLDGTGTLHTAIFNGTGLYIDSLFITSTLNYIDENSPESAIYEILFILGSISKLKELGFKSDELSQRRYYFIDQEGSFSRKIKDSISINIGIIDNSIRVLKFIEAYREENDDNYSKEFTSELNSKFFSLADYIPAISDLSTENIFNLTNSGYYEKFIGIIFDSKDTLESLALEVVNTLYELNEFSENYSLFLTLPRQQTFNFYKSIGILENVENAFNNYSDIFSNILFTDSYKPFRNQIRFSSWLEEFKQKENSFDADLISLFFIFIGRRLQNELNSYSELIDYGLNQVLRYNLVDPSLLTSLYKTNKAKQEKLLIENNLRVVRNYEADLLAFSYKQLLPKLELLDYLTFSEVVENFGTPIEITFRQHIKLLITEAILLQKEYINDLIVRLIDAINNADRENIKNLYLEICLREVLDNFKNYLDGIPNFTNSNIFENTYNFIVSYTSDNAAKISNIESIISDYSAVWTFFYSTFTSLVDAFENGTEIKTFLLEG